MAAGQPPYKSWADVPGGEQSVLTDLAHQFGQLIGFTADLSKASFLLTMANAKIQTLRDMGTYLAAHPGNAGVWGINVAAYPWAKYGIDKETYASSSSIYSSEYKKLTGQDISADALAKAFNNPEYTQILTGSQYQQQLINDANIQKTYGWVKYGMDYSQWNQQKLGMRSELGRDVSDAEASTLLQYNVQSRGSNQGVVARVPQQTPTVGAAGIGQSVVR